MLAVQFCYIIYSFYLPQPLNTAKNTTHFSVSSSAHAAPINVSIQMSSLFIVQFWFGGNEALLRGLSPWTDQSFLRQAHAQSIKFFWYSSPSFQTARILNLDSTLAFGLSTPTSRWTLGPFNRTPPFNSLQFEHQPYPFGHHSSTLRQQLDTLLWFTDSYWSSLTPRIDKKESPVTNELSCSSSLTWRSHCSNL